MNTKDKIFLAIGSVAIMASVGVGALALVKSANLEATPSVKTTNTQVVKPAVVDNSSTGTSKPATSGTTNNTKITQSPYKDGTYTATASYYAHGNVNTIVVTAVIKDSTVMSISDKNTTSDGESQSYIDSFESSVGSIVVGQPISNVSYSRIGGASLTTGGFVSALEKIKSDAAV